ncbi:hypothetical protein RRG08_007080 [Elysia crispata]|uniref:Uncharacterized protein n=1 Tax=Elysia crispata TaxID=231223 RepID=A0AAE0YNU6_9GAST|nr:hypothetical protein RRG08_007080 [Elysia crispata]
MSYQSGSFLLLLTLLLTVAMETQALYFAACWGWGPSCSRHEIARHSRHPVRAVRPSQDSSEAAAAAVSREAARAPSSSSSSSSSSGAQRSPAYRGHGRRGIPSIVTSGGWEPGFMGKRTHSTDTESLNPQEVRSLLQLLQVQSDDRK